jgi:hypothetical protein
MPPRREYDNGHDFEETNSAYTWINGQREGEESNRCGTRYHQSRPKSSIRSFTKELGGHCNRLGKDWYHFYIEYHDEVTAAWPGESKAIE